MIPTEDLPYVTEEITTYEEERRRQSQKDNSHHVAIRFHIMREGSSKLKPCRTDPWLHPLPWA